MIKQTGENRAVGAKQIFSVKRKPALKSEIITDTVDISGAANDDGKPLTPDASALKRSQKAKPCKMSVKRFLRAGLKTAFNSAKAVAGVPLAAVGFISGLFHKEPPPDRIQPGSDLILNPAVEKSTLLTPELQKEIDNATHSKVVDGNSSRLLNNGAESFSERYRVMENAKHSINMQTLIFHSDETGWKTARTLAKKSKEGVKCRLVYDWILSKDSDPKMFKMMKDAGVQVIAYNTPADQNLPDDSLDNKLKYVKKGLKMFLKKVRPRDIVSVPLWIAGKSEKRLQEWKARNKDLVEGIKSYYRLARNRWHMKILTVDGKKGFVGGLNIGSEYAYAGSGKVDQSVPPGSNSRRSCRDTDILVEGPAVAVVNRTFAENWKYAGGMNEKEIVEENPAPQKSGGSPVRFLSHQPVEKGDKDIENWYYKMLANCQKTAYITNAYFVPSEKFKKALCDAAKRGVDVRILTNSKETNNRKDAFHAGRKHYDELLENGVRIYELTDKEFTTLHTKSAVFDGEVGTAGSFNLDPRSFYMHSENNVVVQDKRLALNIHKAFKKDLEMSKEILPYDLRQDSKVNKVKQWFFNKMLKLV